MISVLPPLALFFPHLSPKWWLPFSAHPLPHLAIKQANQNTIPETVHYSGPAGLEIILPLPGNHHALQLPVQGLKMTYFLQNSAHLLIFFID